MEAIKELTQQAFLRIVAESMIDARTITRYLTGLKVRPISRIKINRALIQLGLAHLIPKAVEPQ